MRVFVLLTLFAAQAEAAGFFVHDVGFDGIARQGAIVASGQDLSALWYNPANLSAGRGLRLQLDVNGNVKYYEFQRAADPAIIGSPFPVAKSQFSFTPVPTLAAAYDFGVEGLALALGVYAPNNTDTKFAEKGPTRYSVVSSGSFIFFVHLALSYQPLPWLRFGAGIFATSVFFDQRMAVNLGIGGPESPDFDIYVNIYGQQHFLMNGNFGVWVKPGAGFELGASFLPGRRANASGKIGVEPPKALEKILLVNGDRADFTVDFPWIARGGVAWRYEDVASVEAAYVYEGWSSVKNIGIYPKNVSFSAQPFVSDYQVGDIILERGWRDTHSLRLGCDVLVYRPLGVRARAGYGFETGAVPDELLSVSSNDTTKHNVGVGAVMQIDRWKLGVAWGHSFYLDKTITSSRMRLTNPLVAEDQPVIGNGQYHFQADVFALTVATGF